jgi:nitrogen fixation/metabolism regulation signal transduction histidine kinase
MKNFRLQIIIRIILLAITLAACVFLWLETIFYLSAALVTLFAFYQIFRLIYFVEETNRRLKRFLDSIRYSDFSRSFSNPKTGKSFEELDASFQEVVEAFKKQRIETEVQFRYMQTLVRHISVGLISFNSEGEVELLNTSAKKLFDTSGFQNIEELQQISPVLFDAVNNIENNGRDVVQISINNKSLELAINATVFRLREKKYKLVSFQDINAELETKEMEAWQNLTQVLAHEIMNSITPIASLSDTVKMLIETNTRKNGDGYVIHKDTLEDVTEALDTIENRSEGLMQFVNSYRDFTKIPEPQIKRFPVKKLLQRVQNLNKGEANERNIMFKLSVEPNSLELSADPHLIEQVLINLTKNAFRALENKPTGMIKLEAGLAKRGGVFIRIIDNGPGIAQENLDKIFIPFYSTQRPYKKDGSGIGLSLSRQIMRAHGGSLTVDSRRGEGTTFTLRF